MTDEVHVPDWFEDALAEARALLRRSYSPYSSFPVAAVVVASDGTRYPGVNVENATFGATVCAERSAISRAVTDGAREFSAILVMTPTAKPVAPCGICRQVLREFAPTLTVYSATADGELQRWTIAELLPASFSPEDLR